MVRIFRLSRESNQRLFNWESSNLHQNLEINLKSCLKGDEISREKKIESDKNSEKLEMQYRYNFI